MSKEEEKAEYEELIKEFQLANTLASVDVILSDDTEDVDDIYVFTAERFIPELYDDNRKLLLKYYDFIMPKVWERVTKKLKTEESEEQKGEKKNNN